MDKNGNQREEFGRATKDFINFFENALETKISLIYLLAMELL